MRNLTQQRQAIRPLINEREAEDALAAYYAFYHPDEKTHLVTLPPDAERAEGYMAISRTGIDLFRPLVTMRLPLARPADCVKLIHSGIAPGTAVIAHVPAAYGPLLHALFTVNVEEHLRVLVLDPRRFEPIINVLVSQSPTPAGLPRFVIRSQSSDREIAASASLNWQSPHFADIAVSTDPNHRRQGWGRSVVSAMVQHLLDNGRTPLYVVSNNNEVSQQLAESIGFVDRGIRQVLLQGILKPPPANSV